jgi:hypothetical protein
MSRRLGPTRRIVKLIIYSKGEGGKMASDSKLAVQLKLKWLHDDVYESQVFVTLRDSCYHEVDLKVGLPPGTLGVPEVEYLSYALTYDLGKACSDVEKMVHKSIEIRHSGAKSRVTAFAVVNGKVVGEDSKSFPRGK